MWQSVVVCYVVAVDVLARSIVTFASANERRAVCACVVSQLYLVAAVNLLTGFIVTFASANERCAVCADVVVSAWAVERREERRHNNH
jgi:heme A synthase